MASKITGRRTLLNEDTQSKIVAALRAGNYFDVSCEYAGIAASTGFKWMARGRAEVARREKPSVKEGSKEWNAEQPFVEFLQAISRASSEVQVKNVALIQKAAEGDEKKAIDPDWRAAAWFLERRHPKQWGKQVIEIVNEEISDEERVAKLAQLLETAKKRKGAGQE